MKQIETQQNKEKKESRNKTIIGIILAVIMLLSVAGYGLLSSEKTSEISNEVKYNNLNFYKQGDLWQTEISGYNFYFHYLPNETSSINTKKTLNNYSGKPLYFTGEGEAEQEIARNLYSNKFVLRIQKACLQNENCTENLPVKNCSDNVIIVREEQDSSIIREEDNCIFIISNDTIREADAFLFRILGIK